MFYASNKRYLRFGKFLRPMMVIYVSPNLRVTLRALFDSAPQILDVSVLIVMITFTLAIIGNNLLNIWDDSDVTFLIKP
jgi:hypothetical protein